MAAVATIKIKASDIKCDDANILIDGLIFPGGLEQYLVLHDSLRVYEELSSKKGYKIPIDILAKIQSIIKCMLHYQIVFIYKCIPKYYLVMASNIWSLIYAIQNSLIMVNYPENIKYRLTRCLNLLEVYNDVNKKIEYYFIGNYTEPDLKDYIIGFKIEDFDFDVHKYPVKLI